MKYINVYGTGENALKFILNYRFRTDISIKNVICNDEYEKEEFCGIPTVKISNAEKIMKTFLTVIASSESSYWNIKEKVCLMYSLKEFEHFLYFGVFERKMVIIYGNCHTGPIKEMLKKSKAFSSEYGFYPLPQIQEINQIGGIERYLSGVKGRCNLFIHQCVWENNTYGEQYSSNFVINYLELKSINCRIIGIPNVYRMSRFMFPQMEYGWKTHEGIYGFQFKDKFIDDNYKTMSIKELSDAIREDFSLYDNSDILNNYHCFTEKLLAREKEWDVQISDYIKKNIAMLQLFYDPNHPTNDLLFFIVCEILRMLSIESNKTLLASGVYQLDYYEIPIYGCVKKALGLKYNISEMRRTGMKIAPVAMDLEEYVRQYCCWNELFIKEG